MLLTSAQVSVAVSSSVVFVFTTALFLCGYVLQQQTVKNLREAIKPQPRPTHTSFYLPPQFQPTPTAGAGDGDAIQIIEIAVGSQDTNDGGRPPREDLPMGKATEGESTSEQNLESRDGLKKPAEDANNRRSERQKQENHQQGDRETLGLQPKSSAESPSEFPSNPRKSTLEGETQPPRKRLSMAARRKAIKEEIRRLSGQDLIDNPRAYKRRLW